LHFAISEITILINTVQRSSSSTEIKAWEDHFWVSLCRKYIV